MIKAVPHRNFIFSIPKILRRYFLYDRKLLSELRRCAWETLKVFFQETVPEEDAMENLARYIIRASFSQERMTYIREESKVIYKSKDGRQQKTFDLYIRGR